MSNFTFCDGGREEAGFKGFTGDCVIRAICIATGSDYATVYKEIGQASKNYMETRNDKVARALRRSGTSPRKGVFRQVYESYLESLGWVWIPMMKVGSGCKVNLDGDQFKQLGITKAVCAVSKHLTTMIDGTVYDTYDCSRDGHRCVYGVYVHESEAEDVKKKLALLF